MKISRERKVFLAAALAASIASITGFNVYARMTIRSEALFHAVYESLYYSGIQIMGTIWLMAPFLIIGMISASAAKNDRFARGWCFYICGVLPVMILYLRGYISEAHLLVAKKWTASIFAVAFLPFMCVPILVVLGIVAMLLTTDKTKEGSVKLKT